MLMSLHLPNGVTYCPVRKPCKVIGMSGVANATPGTASTVILAKASVTPVSTVTLTDIAAGTAVEGVADATYGTTQFLAGECMKFTCASQNSVAMSVTLEIDEFNL